MRRKCSKLFVINQFSSFGERSSILNVLVFPYTSLCKMKCSLVGPFLHRFYFNMQSLQTMSDITVFGMSVHEKMF